MKKLRKSYGRVSATWFIAGCLIALVLSVVGPAHISLRFRSADAAPHICRETGRRTTLDLTDGEQDIQIDNIAHEPAPERPLVTLVAASFVLPAGPVLAAAPPRQPFITRRKLLSPRADDPDPLLQP